MHFGHKKLYINGELVDASNGINTSVICPGNEEVVATLAWATQADTDAALRAAQEGFLLWSSMPLQDRLEWIEKLRNKIVENRDLLRNSIMHEMGKVWAGTDEDLTSIINSLEFYSQEIVNRTDIPIQDKEGTHTHKVVQQPVGVVVAFLAYNFPLLNLGFKLGPALAAGCSIVIKPSEYSALSAYIIGELCHEIDFPKGVINVLCGEVEEVGKPLSESTIPRLVTMIGSTETAQKLIAQSASTSIKRYSLECGGNAPFIVFEDADVPAAAGLGAALKIGNSGQICVAPNRFYIQDTILDTFIDMMASTFQEATIGFGRESDPALGPLANKQSIIKLQGIVNRALDQGGILICGGHQVDRIGYYFEPTIIRFDNNKASVLQEEVFGPIAMITSFSNKEEVLQLANDTSAGLASYVYSSDQAKLDFFGQHLEFGEVQLNGVKYDIYLPHGGIKNSGIGMDCSTYALDDYLIKKRVSQAITN